MIHRSRPRLGEILAMVAVALYMPNLMAEEPLLPWSQDKVYWRTEATGRLGAKSDRVKGRLTLDESSLRFHSRKNEIELPLDEIQLVFPGTMGADVDTEWVVVQVDKLLNGRPRLYGIRDARKLGFGHATQKIYEALAERLEQLKQAQFRSGPGWRAFTALDERMVFEVPDDWKITVLSEVYQAGRLATADTRFGSPDREDVAIRFQVLRAPRGFRCEELPTERLAAFLGDGTPEPMKIGHCSGFSAEASAIGAGGRRWVVSNGGSLYVLSLEAPATEADGVREVADRMVKSWRLSVDP